MKSREYIQVKKPRVLFLTEGKDSPSTRFAVSCYIPSLQKKGIHCSIAHRRPEKYALINLPCFNYRFLRIMVYCLFCYPFSLLLRLITLCRIHHYDIAFVQRDLDENHVTPWLEKLYQRHSKCFVFYFDDALWLAKNHFGKPLENKIREIIKMADWVIVSHEYLADYARRFNQSVLIFPLSIDTQFYSPFNTCFQDGTQDAASQVTIGWSGGAWNYPHLVKLAEILEGIKQETGIEILIQCGEPPPPEIKKIGVQYVPWTKDTESQTLHRIDIALCPLNDSPWAHGKFSIKLLQYLACGIPVVCSDVGVNSQIVLDGQVGFVVKNQDEWRLRLLTLIYDKEKREQMAQGARKRAIDYYSLDEAGNRLADFFLSLAGQDSKEATKEKFYPTQISPHHSSLT